jgi:hypothetical protein
MDEMRKGYPQGLTVDLEALSGFTELPPLTQGDQSPPFFAAVLDKVAETFIRRSNIRTWVLCWPQPPHDPSRGVRARTDIVHRGLTRRVVEVERLLRPRHG